MAWLPDGEKISKIPLFVLAQLTNVTDRQTDRRTDGQTPRAGNSRAYAYHRAAKTQLDMPKLATRLGYKKFSARGHPGGRSAP